MLGFENLTWAPLSRDLIDLSLLSVAERNWVDTYHKDVLAKIGPLVDGDVRDWLEVACAPL